MKKSELKSIINEVVNEVVSGDDPNNPLYVEYVADRRGEEPFMMGDKKYQFVTAKYPNGKKDIGVYAFAGDIVYGYQAFRQMHNLKEGVAVDGQASVAAIIDNNIFPHTSEELEKMAEQYHLHVRYVGDAEFGTDTMASYRLVFSGPQGQLDAFVHGIAEEKGIEFHDTNDSHKLQEDDTWESMVSKLGKDMKSKTGLTEDGVGNGWQKASVQNAMSDEGASWRTFATKISKGNKDLERTFHMAISDAEDTAKPMEQIGNGVYTSERVKVEVDLYKGTYRITKLQ
jgi:hypothetical protein